jgi:hypothetical protein
MLAYLLASLTKCMAAIKNKDAASKGAGF